MVFICLEIPAINSSRYDCSLSIYAFFLYDILILLNKDCPDHARIFLLALMLEKILCEGHLSFYVNQRNYPTSGVFVDGRKGCQRNAERLITP
jgi:hypothetical protein